MHKHSAKVFMTGRSQAVRLPKAYRFDTDEVSIERRSDGALVLRPKPKAPLGERVRAALAGLPADAFERPAQPPLERSAVRWNAKRFGTGQRSRRRLRQARARR